jgi:hypothetical protein
MVRATRGGMRCLILAAAATSLWAGQHAAAGTSRHDQPNAFLDNVIYGDPFRMIGGVQMDFTSFGSGVMIEKNWVLTAAHVVADYTPGSYIKFETDPDPAEDLGPNYDPEDWTQVPLSGLFRVEAIAIHEGYNNALGPAGGFDIALLRLDASAPHTDPDYQPYRRYSGTDEIGKIATPVGFGALGDGINGYNVESAAFFRVAGDNYIDAYATDNRIIHEFYARPDVINPATGVGYTREEIAAQYMLSDFDDPPTQDDDPLTTLINEAHVNDGLNPLGTDVALPLEYSVAPGDSGGPALFRVYDDEIGDFIWTVAGINSFIHGLPTVLGGDGTDNASYSDLQGYLRVSLFNEWIDSVLSSTNELTLVSTSGSPVPGDVIFEDPRLPEPATAFGAMAGMLALARRRRIA